MSRTKDKEFVQIEQIELIRRLGSFPPHTDRLTYLIFVSKNRIANTPTEQKFVIF